MDKREACHRLAEINEEVYELEESLSDIERNLLVADEDRRQWLLEKRVEAISRLEKSRREHDEFLDNYYDIIHS